METAGNVPPPNLRWRLVAVLAALYFFLFSISLLGHGFKLLGGDFAATLLETTSNPFLGLFLGVMATAVIQSSSTTTSIVVGLVAVGGLRLETAIPVLMGANIGTSVTNTLVSFGHATRRAEFRRAFSAAIVHDIFNFCSVLVLFPIEMAFHPIQSLAQVLQDAFAGLGGMSLFNPVNFLVSPAVDLTDHLLAGVEHAPAIMIAISLVVLFAALATIVKQMRVVMIDKAEVVIDRYIFGRMHMAFLVGIIMTVLVQSSSVSTSLLIPLAGAGILTVTQIYPFTLGANVGTTITAMLASLATGSEVAVTVAFAHLSFNLFGILIFYPLKVVPITIAKRLGTFAGASARNVVIVIACFIAIYVIPLIIYLL